MSKKILVVDIDGPMLDYNKAYAEHWAYISGTTPEILNRGAYWAMDQYNVPHLSGTQLASFLQTLDANFFATMEPMSSAVHCINKLAELVDIIAVTTSDKKFNDVRNQRLLDLGFKIAETISTGRKVEGYENPKAKIINELNAWGAIDDLPLGLTELKQSIKTFLIARNADDPKAPSNDKSVVRQMTNCAIFNLYGEYRVSGLYQVSAFIEGFYQREFKEEAMSPLNA